MKAVMPKKLESEKEDWSRLCDRRDCLGYPSVAKDSESSWPFVVHRRAWLAVKWTTKT